jgi:hypothetical protein
LNAGSLSCVHQPGVATSLMPPPLPIQAGSAIRLPLASETRLVPPTAVVNSPEAGQFVPGKLLGTPVAATNAQPSPLSPDYANSVWPCIAPSCRITSLATSEPSRYGGMSQPPTLADIERALLSETNRFMANRIWLSTREPTL